jgi:hypothetical protein
MWTYRRFGVFDYIETPEVYVNAEEVADKIGSSVELTEAEQNEREELEKKPSVRPTDSHDLLSTSTGAIC